MAKKEKNSGLGRGLDSLIPKIEEKELEEGISLENLLKESEETKKESKKLEDIVEETTDGVDLEESGIDDNVEIIEEENKKAHESSNYTNVFYNDDEKVKLDDEISEKIEERIRYEKTMENIDSASNLNEEKKLTTQIVEASDDLNELDSLLSEKEEKLIDEVIETVENNPRITLWSARSAAVLRYLRKTEPEFSISNEASNLIDDAIAKKYPEVWTLFNHL
ncbi:hypothetical protein [Methanobrevibacter olleyae]|uniref:Uncharacterized protein n=1 Tax=Methanobrevibacter olleyae TaxID=294671 RepID=A0A126R1F1_METOL|nr:hypothetical protein [Methanobrevibacter olleyae]AMK16210.1 hypothetical protein YLM1_1655 [Methanobrevibacter olleyae]SFL53486.1 hypothetical protein SAMN02910297_01161 [Methanobrevibacter olleyae]